MKNGAELISNERIRQIDQEGYSTSHDKEHHVNEFVLAALAYLDCNFKGTKPLDYWPWEENAFKPKDYKNNLVRAGALIAAAIDRLQIDEVE